VQQDGRDFDLHNDFDFVGFSYSVSERIVELRWVRSHGDWVHSGMPAGLILSCRGVTHLSATPRDPEMPFTEDDCLSDIGFALPKRPAEDAFAVSPAAPAFDPSWHWLFSFMSGFTLRIAGDTAQLSTQEA
jgi:hypothetical protein